MVLKYMKEFLILVFGFLAFISLLFLAVFVLALPAVTSHYLDTLGYNDFVVYSVFIFQYMIIYVIARSVNFIDDEIINF